MKTGLRRLRYFIVVSDRLSFRRAAADLAMTQPALSRAIAQLEADLGIALLQRDNRRVSLTEAGQIFREGCREALDVLEGAVQRTRKAALEESGRLSIGYTDIAIAGCLPEIVRSFRLEHPDILATLRQSFAEAQYDLLRRGDIDVGLLTGPVHDTALEHMLVQSDRFVALLPVRHRLAKASQVTLRDLADEPFVLGSEDKWRVYHDILYEECRASGFEPRVVQRAPDTQGIVGLVACGMGVSIQTESVWPSAEDGVRMVPIRGCRQPVETYLAWNRAEPRMAVRAFVEHVGNMRRAATRTRLRQARR